MPWHARDHALREAAFSRVVALQRLYDNQIPWAELAAGVSVGGQMVPIATKAEGIYKPKGHPAVLSIKTTIPRTGRANPYSDELAKDGQLIRYAYRERGGPDHAANQSMRVAFREQLPLVYFFGLEPGVYAALAPVYIVGDARDRHEFLVAPSSLVALGLFGNSGHDAMVSPPTREYAARVVMQRLHQQAFRKQVLSAYDHHCAMCSIYFDEFLDAAHIVPDSEPLGVPTVSNGLALCGLHHRAFDRFLVDVDDNYRLQLSPALLQRRDGPIFQSAFLDRHDRQIRLPSRADQLPERSLLRARRLLAPPGLWIGG